MWPDITGWVYLFEVSDHKEELFIVWTTCKGPNRYSIIEIKCERDNRIVNYDKLIQLSILNDPQVLNKYAIGRIDTMLSVQSVLYDTALLVDNIEHGVGVELFTCSENTDLIHVR